MSGFFTVGKSFVKLYGSPRYRLLIGRQGDYIFLEGVRGPVHKSHIYKWTNK